MSSLVALVRERVPPRKSSFLRTFSGTERMGHASPSMGRVSIASTFMRFIIHMLWPRKILRALEFIPWPTGFLTPSPPLYMTTLLTARMTDSLLRARQMACTGVQLCQPATRAPTIHFYITVATTCHNIPQHATTCHNHGVEKQ